MTKSNTKSIITVLILVIILAAVIYFVIKSIKKAGSNLVAATNDVVANSVIGDIIGVRSTAAKKAFARLMALPFLKHNWITKANAKYNTSGYELILPFTTQQATDYARDLKASKAIISTDYTNDNNRALGVLMTLQNWVEAAQVADAYYNIGNHQDLNRGLAWMSNDALVEAADYLESIPTGVKQNGVLLQPNQIRV